MMNKLKVVCVFNDVHTTLSIRLLVRLYHFIRNKIKVILKFEYNKLSLV